MQLDTDIDWPKLVTITDGYSGADISNVCRDAAMMPMRRALASGHSIQDISGMQNEIDIPLCLQDFLDAIKNISKSVSKDQLNDYSEWMKQFGSV